MITYLFTYSLKAAFTLSLLYVPYALMLKNEAYFRLNRAVLLSIAMLSLTLPLVNVSSMSLDHTPVMQAAQQQMIGIGMPVHIVGTAAAGQEVSLAEESVSLFRILAIIYTAGLLLTVLVRLSQICVLGVALGKGNLWTKRLDGGIRLCCRKGQFAPYSWLRTIVISQEDWETNRDEILLHETGHILHHHSYDMLLTMLCQALQWYNPLVWMFGTSLSDVHEYEADDYVLRQGIDMRAYQMLLIKKAVGASAYTFANSFNHSLTKKRITMMHNSNQSMWRRSRVLYVIPMAVLSLSVFATPEFTMPELSSPVTNSVSAIPEPVEHTVSAEPVKVPDVLPEYPGGSQKMWEFIIKNMKYPQPALDLGIEGRVFVKFVVSASGAITDVTPIRCGSSDGKGTEELADLCVTAYKKNAEAKGETEIPAEKLKAVRKGYVSLMEEAIRIVRKMPDWKPGKVAGENVDCEFTLPIVYRLN